ncbi:AMP-binding enzyme [Rhodococcus sp. BE178]|uniref:AMP-binding enzyme n=1 Tax=Rhodococcus sp. BE178 TaxID=2817737 RepID=UPI003D1E38D7
MLPNCGEYAVTYFALKVESAIAVHPDVAMVAVFGHPDDLFGERVFVALVPEPGSQPTEGSLSTWAAQRLADYKVPVEWQFLDEMPLNASGKILKRQLRQTTPTVAP